MFVIIKNKSSHICSAYRCGNPKASKKRFCHKHHARFQKETNPSGYFYSLLKQNANRRGKEFDLSLDEFKQFCLDTNYMELKGKSAKSASIDRIDHTKGYSIGNIQVLSLRDNSAKRWEDEKEDCPF